MSKIKWLLFTLIIFLASVFAFLWAFDYFTNKVADSLGIEEYGEIKDEKQPADLNFNSIKHAGEEYDVVIFDPAKDKIRFYWQDEAGKRYGNFKKLKEVLAIRGEKIIFATNGSLYGTDYAPLGLYIEDGILHKDVIEGKGEGNFSIKPNGIFVLYSDRAEVVKTENYHFSEEIKYANQSGPMLVHDGAINANFKFDSDSKYIRSGVGVDKSGNVVFAISQRAVNFYEFAELFKDELGCLNALYLDGSISEMYAAGTERQSSGLTYAVIIAVIE